MVVGQSDLDPVWVSVMVTGKLPKLFAVFFSTKVREEVVLGQSTINQSVFFHLFDRPVISWRVPQQ